MVKTLLGCVAAVILSAAGGQQARAGSYGAFVVRNPSRVTIHYQVKWGDGEWQSYRVAPGYRQYHAYPLDEDGRAPAPYVRFDCICGDDDVTYKTYHMNFYAVDDAWEGKAYVFRHSPGGKFLDLYQE
jgi:hypothetical protein